MNFVSRLMRAFQTSAEPKARTMVAGFTVTVEKKNADLLHSNTEESLDLNPTTNGSYFEVTVKPNGQNAEYPETEPMKCYFAIGQNTAVGYNNGVNIIPKGSIYKAFTVYEDFDDGKIRGMFIGRRRPPHHTIMLKAEFKHVDGHTSHMAIGNGLVRKSEMESDAWKASDNNPIIEFI